MSYMDKMPAEVKRLIDDRRAAVALIYALLLLPILVALGVGLDGANSVATKYRLNLAADAAAITCAETWQGYVEAGAPAATRLFQFQALEDDANRAAKARAVRTFLAQAGTLDGILQPRRPNVTTEVNNDSTASVTCSVSYQANNPNYLMQVAGIKSTAISGTSSSNVSLPPFTRVYFVLDTSGSMMVGSTPRDQALIANWVAGNTCSVFTPEICQAQPTTNAAFCASNPNALNCQQGGGDVTPCAFACHEEDGPFRVSGLQQGETVAHQVGATTRFDVMQQALLNDPVAQSSDYCGGPGEIPCVHLGDASYEGLLPYLRDTYMSSNSRSDLGTFSFDVYGFNSGIAGDEPEPAVLTQDQPDMSQYYVTDQTSLPAVAMAVNALQIGLMTHLNPPVNSTHAAVLPSLVNIVGSTKKTSTPGSTSDNPLKFVVLVTDGLNSDRNWNFGDYSGDPDPLPPGAFHPTPIDYTTYCNMWAVSSPAQIPTVDGVQIWGVTPGAKTLNMCSNPNYVPGFYNGTIPPGASAQAPYGFEHSGYNLDYYGGPIDPSYCAMMKSAPGSGSFPGVTVAVLETPYVPLNAQQPDHFAYEATVQSVIWPNGNPAVFGNLYPQGPNGQPMSAVSQALQSCATSPSYYFQATDDAAIKTGFITLFNNFIGNWVHITR